MGGVLRVEGLLASSSAEPGALDGAAIERPDPVAPADVVDPPRRPALPDLHAGVS